MAFERIEFFKICMDIEKYLGYLRGNELAAEYLETVNHSDPPDSELRELYQQRGISLDGWKTPCPEEKWKVQAHGHYGGPTGVTLWLPYDVSDAEVEQVESEIKTNLTTAYNNGLGWADGLALYLDNLCQQFTHVDVSAMANAVLDIKQEVVTELGLGARDDWAGIGKMLERWNGQGATSFYGFYENYDDALELFTVMSAQICGGFAACTGLIHGTQEAAMKYVESVRAAIEIMAAFWVECGLTTPPSNPGDAEVDIANILAIAGDIWALLRLIPSVKKATEGVNTAVDAIKHLTSLVGHISTGDSTPELHIEPAKFDDWTANGLYQAITKHAYEDIYQKYDQAMDDFHNGEIDADVENADEIPFRAKTLEDAMLELQGARNEWELPTVPPGNLNQGQPPAGYGY